LANVTTLTTGTYNIDCGFNNHIITGITGQITLDMLNNPGVPINSITSTLPTSTYIFGVNVWLVYSATSTPASKAGPTTFKHRNSAGTMTTTGNTNNIKWVGGTPTLTYTNGKIDILSFVTYDSGYTWVGFLSAQGV
jgi:hypothetical protein